MAEYGYSLGNSRRLLPHQPVIAADIGFALGTIDDQQFDLFPPRGQFDVGGKACSAKPGNAGIMDPLDQIHRCMGLVVRQREAFAPPILAIGTNVDACLAKAGGVSHSVRFNRDDFARSGSMNGNLHPGFRSRQGLARQYFVSYAHNHLGTGADMLLEG